MNKVISTFNDGVDFQSLYREDPNLEKAVMFVFSRHAEWSKISGINPIYTRIEGDTLHLAVNMKAIEAGIVERPEDFDRSDSDTFPISSRKIRNVIGDLRLKGALILSTGGKYGGYWMANSPEELEEFLDGEYESRALDMLTKMSRMRREGIRKWGNQLSLGLFGSEVDGIEYVSSVDGDKVWLKVCPSCDSDNLLIDLTLLWDDEGSYDYAYVYCKECYMRGPGIEVKPGHEVSQEAADKWNEILRYST